jgi:hypothetical protein
MLINHPGSWQQFQYRPDNKNLSVMEMKSKYLHEQYLFEAQIITLNQMHQQNTFMNGGGGGPTPSPSSEPSPPSYSQELKLVFNDTLANVSSNYGFDVTSFTAWNSDTHFSNLNAEAISVDNDTRTIILKSNTSEGAQIAPTAFDNDTYLVEIEDINSNYVLTIRGGAFYASLIESVILNGVTGVQNGSTFFNTVLTTLQLDALTAIENSTDTNGAFYRCDLGSASSIRFTNLTEIGDFVFQEATLYELKDSSFPVLSTIGEFAFQSAVIDVIDSSTVQTIGFRAFINSAIASLTLTGVVDFGGQSFASTIKLAEITLPEDCTFGTQVFQITKTLGTAYVSVANAADANILYLENDRGWTINP